MYSLQWVLDLTSANNCLQMLNIMYTRKKMKVQEMMQWYYSKLPVNQVYYNPNVF